MFEEFGTQLAPLPLMNIQFFAVSAAKVVDLFEEHVHSGRHLCQREGT